MRRVLLIILYFSVLFVPAHFSYAATATKAPIKILIVPGHDNQVWGAQYGNIKEADMNLGLATKIYNLLKKDKRFEVHITRNTSGYTKEFDDYFTTHHDDIATFKENAKATMKEKIDNGTFVQKENTPHNNASEDVALKLYGINKWTDEHEMDAVIHVHFNDYPRPDKWTAGKYKGFVIYTPEEQMVNSIESNKLAGKIFTQLRKKYAVSTYEPEKAGIVPDQSLIALGSNGTLLSSVRSLLIEYGYIYRFSAKKLPENYTNMANFTAAGIKNYFFPTKAK